MVVGNLQKQTEELITFVNIVLNYLFFTFFRWKPDKAVEECTQRSSVTAGFK